MQEKHWRTLPEPTIHTLLILLQYYTLSYYWNPISPLYWLEVVELIWACWQNLDWTWHVFCMFLRSSGTRVKPRLGVRWTPTIWLSLKGQLAIFLYMCVSHTCSFGTLQRDFNAPMTLQHYLNRMYVITSMKKNCGVLNTFIIWQGDLGKSVIYVCHKSASNLFTDKSNCLRGPMAHIQFEMDC